jgi:hypothetical protein
MPEVVEWRVFIEEGAAETNKELFEQVDGAMKQGLPVLGEARNDICTPCLSIPFWLLQFSFQQGSNIKLFVVCLVLRSDNHSHW